MGITKRKVRKLDAIARANHPDCRKAQRAHSARPFVLCGIPVRRPHKHSLEYSRQNGKCRLRVIGHPDYGLPFGQDRLLLIWIASMATRQKSRAVRFRSAAAILDPPRSATTPNAAYGSVVSIIGSTSSEPSQKRAAPRKF